MSTRTYELTVPVRKGERGMGIVLNPENCVIELAADGPAMPRRSSKRTGIGRAGANETERCVN